MASAAKLACNPTNECTLRRRFEAGACTRLLEASEGDFSWLIGDPPRTVVLSHLWRAFPQEEIPGIARVICDRKMSTREFFSCVQAVDGRQERQQQEHDPTHLLKVIRHAINRYCRARAATPQDIRETLHYIINTYEL